VRTLFLDIDGVLNSHKYFIATMEERKEKAWDLDQDDRWEAMLDPECVARLDRIVRETGAQVVISSTWRILNPYERVEAFLRTKGFTGKVIGATTTSYGLVHDRKTERGDQIAHWLAHTPAESFIILDDDSDMAGVSHRHIKTTYDTGLTDEQADKAIAMLKET
jgi:HAD domain in Swiss Army Knife RNA repair proteins